MQVQRAAPCTFRAVLVVRMHANQRRRQTKKMKFEATAGKSNLLNVNVNFKNKQAT